MTKATDAGDNNLSTILKGAPERVLTRCTKILIDGEEVDFTPELQAEVKKANDDFGMLGERVLAFAKYNLPSAKYSKTDYKFDVKSWKTWGLNAKQ